ncbi:MAG TPA: dihydrodipicolinate synthase family protein [Tepidisphaeraceae bacterium]|nr:dihydrodipicolinate synthase family protein [Tepidisphaeraceae bacterium]
MKQRIQGIIPPMVTPLRSPDVLDVEGLERLVEHLISGGVHALFILGTTGEGPALSHRLRRELIDRTCRLVRGRLPVLVGITDTSLIEALEIGKHAADAGAFGAVTACPYYFRADQSELLTYVERLLEQLPLPLMLYNIPYLARASFEPQTVERLLDRPGILGVKDTTADLAQFDQLLPIIRRRPDWSLLVGPEHYLAESVARGGDGGVNGGANLVPRLFVELFNAARANDASRVDALQKLVVKLGALYRIGGTESGKFKGLKCAMSVSGICDDLMTEPFGRLGDAKREEVRRFVESLRSEIALSVADAERPRT